MLNRVRFMLFVLLLENTSAQILLQRCYKKSTNTDSKPIIRALENQWSWYSAPDDDSQENCVFCSTFCEYNYPASTAFGISDRLCLCGHLDPPYEDVDLSECTYENMQKYYDG